MKIAKIKKFYTTGNIARYCEVDINTVKNWIRQGMLDSFKTPSGHYRIDRSEFISFIKEQGFAYDPEYFGEEIHETDVLIIEDDEKQIALLSYTLKVLYKNLKIDTTSDGFEGYMKIIQNLPKLILLDLNLPNYTGLELLQALNKSDKVKKVKVLVISAYLDDDVMNELKELHVDGMISKPVDKNELKKNCDLLLSDRKMKL